MVILVVSITLKPGKRDDFLKIFKANMPAVHAEKGCIEYFPAVDLPTGMPVQVTDENVVTIIEKWESPDALGAHSKSPHMADFREKTKDMVEGMTLKVLQGA